MAVAITDAGESLIARLQSEGLPLIIDRFIFAFIQDLDPSQDIDRAAGVPDNVMYSTSIPKEFRAYVTPNQVVYSALLGSEVGDFSFNWQGLYCTEYDTLVAVATFPALRKRTYDGTTRTPGNNFTRNFILSFFGARELTQIMVEAKVWQLDFTVRLRGIDERERLSNRDSYGRSGFWDVGWLLALEATGYTFLPGVGYVEGIRTALSSKMQVQPEVFPCNVWLDVCLEPQGADIITTIAPLFLVPAEVPQDYTAAAPANTCHYVEKVAYIPSEGAIPVDLRRILSNSNGSGTVITRITPRIYFMGQF